MMKRNILLSFLLLGLIALEYGCTEEPMSCSGSSEMSVTGVNDIEYLVSDTSNSLQILAGESASYDELQYRIILDWERIASSE
jgi:hypothetical protein